MPVVFDDEQQAPPVKPRGKVVFDEPADTRTAIEKIDQSIPGTPEDAALGAQLDQENAVRPQPSHSFMDDVSDFRIAPDFDVGSLWKAIKGAPETALAGVNNAAAAGIAGITAPLVSQNDDDSAGYIRDFMEHNSYTPQTDSGRELSGALGDMFAPMQHGKEALGDAALEATGSPLAATGAYMAPDILSVLFGPKPSAGNYGTAETRLGPVTTKSKAPPADMSDIGDFLEFHNDAAPPPRKAPRVDPDNRVGRARAAGIKVLPSDAERLTGEKPGLVDRMAEAIAPEDVRRDMTLENQKAGNQLVREKVGAPDGAVLDKRGVENQKKPHFDTYQEVQDAINIVPPSEDYLFALDEATQRAGFPAGSNPSVTEVISALRTKARRKINNPNADDKLEAEGRLAGQAADKLEEAMGTELKNTGQEELLAKYQDARESLAELNDIKKSQRGGNIDPQKLRKLDEKNPGRMTGQTKLLADIAEDFPDLKSSMTGAGKKKTGGGELTREGVIARGAKKAARGVVKGVSAVTGGKLADRLLVESEGFQNRMGEAATPSERSYFSDYGKKPKNGKPPSGPPPGAPPQQSGVVPSKAVTLSDRLELEPDAVANPEKMPEKPDTLTADTPPRSRGDLAPKFDVQAEADRLAGDLGLDIRTGTKGAVGKKELSDLLADQGAGNLEVAPPREMEQLELTPKARTEQPNNSGLTSPPTRGKLSSAIDDKGNITIRHEDGGELSAIELPGQDVVQIKSAQVPKEARGQGRYTSMVQALVRQAKKDGKRVWSDSRVSEPAQRAWAALKKAGLKVKQNPATRQASGELVSNSELKPVFEIVDDLVAE
jgi:predicted GNAT family acetyltransferase